MATLAAGFATARSGRACSNHPTRCGLKRHAGEHDVAPNHPALPNPLTGIEAEIEFFRQICAAVKLQTRALGAEIADDARHLGLPRHNELRALENSAPRKPSSLDHGEPPIYALRHTPLCL
jgi:hypothetical protein